jgi:hypothetical protein
MPIRAFRRTSLFAAAAIIAAFASFAGVSAQSTGGIKGKVRTMRGEGIAGATVTARQKGEDVKTVTADRRGNFILDGLEAGRYNLVFDAPGYSSGVLYNVEVERRKVQDLGDRLMLSADRGTQVIVTGSVFFREGTSVPGARIEVERISSDGSSRSIGSTYTNTSGEFTFRHTPGAAKFRITATHKGVKGIKEIDVDQAAIYRLAITLDLASSKN